MISAVKMRRAVANVLATRSYANLAWEMVKEIAQKTNVKHHPLLARREIKRIGLILVTSNRGLAGGFSSRLLQEVHTFIKNSQKEVDLEVDVVLTGRRGKKIYHKFGHTVVAEFEKLDLTTRVEEILPMAQMVVKEYMEEKYDKVVVAFMDYVSAINQTPKIKQILPIEEYDGITNTLGVTAPVADEEITEPIADDEPVDYGFTFEPNPPEVLEVLLPRLIEMQIYQAILESDASEHSARMLAMRNASDAANDMIKELNYSYNKARQAAITQEIAEIVGGAAALE